MMYGYAKNEQDNIAPDELEAFRELAAIFLALDDAQLDQAVEHGVWKELNINE